MKTYHTKIEGDMQHAALLRKAFPAKLVDEVRPKDGREGWDVVYPAVHFGENAWVAVERYEAPDVRDEEYTRGRIELHILDDKGKWAGPSLTIYMPEVKSYYFRDDGDRELKFQHAYISCSSGGNMTPEQAEAASWMLELAAQVARQLDEDLLPTMQKVWDKMIEQRDARKAEREERQGRIKAAHATISFFHDTQVRVTETGRKSPIVGKLLESPNTADYIVVETNFGKKYNCKFALIEKFETKDAQTGRFENAFWDSNPFDLNTKESK